MPSNITVRLPSAEELDAYAVEQWEVWDFVHLRYGTLFVIFLSYFKVLLHALYRKTVHLEKESSSCMVIPYFV